MLEESQAIVQKSFLPWLNDEIEKELNEQHISRIMLSCKAIIGFTIPRILFTTNIEDL